VNHHREPPRHFLQRCHQLYRQVYRLRSHCQHMLQPRHQPCRCQQSPRHAAVQIFKMILCACLLPKITCAASNPSTKQFVLVHVVESHVLRLYHQQLHPQKVQVHHNQHCLQQYLHLMHQLRVHHH
jgi:hypothetical protein